MNQYTHSQEEFEQVLQALYLEKKRVKDLQKKLQEIGSERNELRQQIEQLTTETTQQESYQTLESSENTPGVDGSLIQNLRAEITELRERIKYKEEATEELQSELEHGKARIEELQDYMKSPESRIHQSAPGTLEHILLIARQTIDSVSQKQEGLGKEQGLKSLQRLKEFKSRQFQQELDIVQQEKEAIQENARSLEIALREEKAVKQTLQQDFEAEQYRSNELYHKLKKSLDYFCSLKEEHKKVSASFQAEKEGREAIQAVLDLEKQRASELREHLKDSVERFNSLNQQYTIVAKQAAEEQEKNKNFPLLCQSIHAQKNSEILFLQTHLENSLEQIQTTKLELAELHKAFLKEQEINEECNHSLAEEKENNTQLREHIAHQIEQFSNLEQELYNLKEHLKGEQAHNIQLREEIQIKEEIISELKLELEQNISACGQKSEEIAHLETVRAQLFQLQENVAQQELFYQKLEENLEAAEKESTQLKEELEKAQQSLQSSLDAIQAKEVETQQLCEYIEEIKQANSTLEKTLELQQQEYSNFIQETADYKKLAKSKSQFLLRIATQLKKRYTDKEQETEHLSSSLQEAQDALLGHIHALGQQSERVTFLSELVEKFQAEQAQLFSNQEEYEEKIQNLQNLHIQQIGEHRKEVEEQKATYLARIQQLLQSHSVASKRVKKLLDISCKLKSKYLESLKIQQRYQNLAQYHKDCAYDTSLKLNEANDEIKTFHSLLNQERCAHEDVLVDFSQHKEKFKELESELQHNKNELETIRIELLGIGSIMDQQFSIDDTKKLSHLAVQLKEALIAKIATCDRLSKQVENLDKENQELKTKECALKLATKKFYTEMKRLQVNNSKQLEPIAQENESLKQEQAEIREQVAHIQEALHNTQRELSDAYIQLDQAKSAYDLLEEKNDDLHLNSIETENKLNMLKRSLELTSKELAETQVSLEEGESLRLNLEREKQSILAREKKLALDLEVNQQELQRLRTQIKEQQQNTHLTEQIEILEANQARLEQENSELKAQKNLFAKQTNDTKDAYAELEGQLIASQKHVIQLQEDYQRLLQDSSHARLAYTELEQQLRAIEAQFEGNISKIRDLEKKCVALESENLSLREEIERSHKTQLIRDHHIENLKNSLDNLKAAQGLLEQENENRSNYEKQLVEEMESLRDSWIEAKSMLENSQNEIVTLREAYETVSQQKEELGTLVESERQHAENVKTQLASVCENYETLKQQMSQFESQYNVLERGQEEGGTSASQQEIYEQLQEAKNALAQLNEMLVSVQAEAEEFKGLYEELQKENSSLRMQDQKLQEDLHGKQIHIAELQEKLDLVYSQCNQLRQEAHEIQSRHADIKKMQEEWQAASEDTETYLKEKDREIKRLVHENTLLKQEYDYRLHSEDGQTKVLQSTQQELLMVQSQLDEIQGKWEDSVARYAQLEKQTSITQLDLLTAQKQIQEIEQEYSTLQDEQRELKKVCTLLQTELEQTQQMKNHAIAMLEQTQLALVNAKNAQDAWKKEKAQWLELGSLEECAKFKQQMELLFAQLQEKTKDHARLYDEYTGLRADYNVQSTDLGTLQKRFEFVNEELNNAKGEWKGLNNSYQELFQSNNALREREKLLVTSLESSVTKIKHYESLLVDLDANQKNYESKLEELTQNNQTLSQEIETLAKTLESRETQIELHAKNLENSRKAYEVLQGEMTQVCTNLEKAKGELLSKLVALETAETEQQQLQVALQAQKENSDLQQTEIQKLENALQASANETQTYRTEIAGLQATVEKMEEELNTRSERINVFSSEIQELKVMLMQGVKEAKEIEKQYLSSVKEKADMASQLQQMQEQLVKTQQRLQDYKQQSEKNETLYIQTSKKLDELDLLLKKGQEEQNVIQERLGQANQLLQQKSRELTSTYSELGTVRSNYESQLAAAEQLGAQITELVQKLELKDSEHVQLNQRYELLWDRFQESEQLKTELEEKLQISTRQQEQNQAIASQLQQEITNLNVEKERFEKGIISLRQERDALMQRGDNDAKARVRLEQELQTLEAEYQQHKQQFAKKVKESALLYEALEKSKTQARDLHHQLNTQRVQNESLKQSVELQKQHNEELKSLTQGRLQTAESQVKEWQTKYEQLRYQIDEKMTRLEALEKIKEDYERMKTAFSNLTQFISGGNVQGLGNVPEVSETEKMVDWTSSNPSTATSSYVVDAVPVAAATRQAELKTPFKIKQDLFD